MRPESPQRALRLDIDGAALTDNWRTLDKLSGTASAAAAVKADAYGLGARQVVPILRKAGCTDFLVAHFSELSDLVDLVDPGRLSVLHGPLNRGDAAYARALGVKPVINSTSQARLWLESGGGPCDLMVDTGINRLGLELENIGDDAVRKLEVDVLMSHLASADEDTALNEVQRRRWGDACRAVRHRRASLANSAGIALGPLYHGDMTRPGLSIYGGVPRAELAGKIRQVVRPHAAILQVRHLAAGEAVGYNSTFVAECSMRVGTIALGYADGYLRSWSRAGLFEAAGVQLPILGRVSMDMTVIDLGSAPHLREGDWVEAAYSLPEASVRSGLSQYELLTSLGSRFSRKIV